MKKVYIKISVLIMTLGAIACDGKLDLDPEQSLSTEVAIGSAENIRNLLVGIYDEAAHGSAEGPDFEENIYGGIITLTSELLANAGDLSWNGSFIEPREINFKQITPINTFTRDIWLNGYEVINQANIVLNNLNKFSDEAEKNKIEGEAKFLRALTYFDLARFFGKPFESGQVNSQLAVPIMINPVLSPSDVTKPPRDSVEAVYTLVVQDLVDAIALLPESNDVFADKYTAEALLARVYLQQANYSNALIAANNVITNSEHSLTENYADAFNNNEDSAEDVFSWQITSQDGQNDMNTFWSGSDFGGRPGDPDISVTDLFLNVYDDINDERRNFFYTARDRATTKWQSEFSNIPFIRLAELFLIRSECNQRLGSTTGATPLDDVNTLRNRANAAALTSVDLDEILRERKRELSFEGHAIHDAKRLKANVGSLAYDDDDLVLPIPQRELDANPNLEPNP
jgi:tetratricopeptide (TPR) repeat protein